MAAAHRRAARGYGVAAIGLLTAGAAIGTVGLAGIGLSATALGLVVAATAAIAWKKSIEHGDRADGAEVLREEWQDAAAVPERRARLMGLIRRLYA
jgi:hypothetical protein